MKSLLLLTFVTASSRLLAESAVLPEPFDRSRYQETLAKSPFVLATPPEPAKEEPKDSPLNNLVVTGMGKLDNGREFVLVQRIGDERAMKFEGNDPNGEGIRVKQVKWGERWDKSIVVMTYGTEEREVKFKENPAPVIAQPPTQQGGGRSSGAAVNAPPPIMPTSTAPRPGMPTTSSGIPRPTTPTMQVPRPGGGATLQAPPSFRGSTVNPGFNGAQPAAGTPNAGAPRQRVRSINNR
jgi:hypothetical protein